MMGIVLSAVLAGTVLTAAPTTASAAVPNNRTVNITFNVLGSFNDWGTTGQNIVQLSDNNSDGILEGIVEIPMVTPDMICQDAEQISEDTIELKDTWGVDFIVQASDNEADYWGDYSSYFQRYYQSCRNVCVPAEAFEPLTFKVLLDTTKGDFYNWSLSYDLLPSRNDYELTNDSRMSLDRIIVGDSTTVKLMGYGGTDPLEFAVYYKEQSQTSWTCVRKYSPLVKNTGEYPDGTWSYMETIAPEVPGQYTVRTKLKDASGAVVNKDFSLHVLADDRDLRNDSTVTIDDYELVLGDSVTVECKAVGGTAPYEFAVFYKQEKQTKWTCAQSYKSNRSVSVVPKAATKYNFRIKVRDAAGKVVNKDIDLDVLKEHTDFENNSYYSYSGSQFCLGQDLTVMCSASGGHGPYEFAVFYKQESQTKWTCAQSYKSNDIVNITPKAATSYNIRVKAKDQDGRVQNKDFSLQVIKQSDMDLVNRSLLATPDHLSPGGTVNVICDSEYAQGTVQYAVYYKQEKQTNWTCAQKFSTNTDVVISPKAATTYLVRIEAKDKRNVVSEVEYNFEVKNYSLTNKSYMPSYSILGDYVCVELDAFGGVGPYEYAVYYKQAKQTNWTCAQSYSTDAYAVFIQPKAATLYDVRVKVKDSKGKVSVKDLKLKVVRNGQDMGTIPGNYRPVYSPDYLSSLNNDSPAAIYPYPFDGEARFFESGMVESYGQGKFYHNTWQDNYDGTITVDVDGRPLFLKCEGNYLINPDDNIIRLEKIYEDYIEVVF